MSSKFLKTVCLILALGVTACTHNGTETGEIYDPWEDSNRTSLEVNDALDRAVLEPVAKGYRAVTPRAGRVAVSNFLKNLNSPVVMGNQLLQGDIEGFGNTSARAFINTLAGFGGILDLAEEGGIPHEPEDFGQTLAVWGAEPGPYLMVPFFGPSNVRDLSGNIVDGLADPLRIYLFNIDREPLHYARVGAGVVSKREELIGVIDDLRRNSFDYYAAIRSAYNQQRQALIRDQKDDVISMDIPDYE